MSTEESNSVLIEIIWFDNKKSVIAQRINKTYYLNFILNNLTLVKNTFNFLHRSKY